MPGTPYRKLAENPLSFGRWPPVCCKFNKPTRNHEKRKGSPSAPSHDYDHPHTLLEANTGRTCTVISVGASELVAFPQSANANSNCEQANFASCNKLHKQHLAIVLSRFLCGALEMTGPFRPLFGPFRTDILAEQATNAPEAGQKELSSNSVLCPKARFKVAQKQLVELDKSTKPAEENPRLEMAHSQSSGDEQSEKEKEVPAAFSSPANSEAAEDKMEAFLEDATQKQDDSAVCGKAQVELSLVAGFTDSLSGFLRGNFSEQQSLQGAGAVKPLPQNADSMQALLAGLNESLPAFPAGTSMPAVESLATDTVDFMAAFPLQSTQSDSLPTFRDFFSQQNSQPSPAGVADHRFFQPQVQKVKLVPRRAGVEPSGPTCSEKRKAEWEDPSTAGAPEESDMETDGERGLQEGSSDKACNGRKSPRCMSRTEEQRMKDRAKAKRHRQRKKVCSL